jgi:NDP-sugar pyrophosphorylase family protein
MKIVFLMGGAKPEEIGGDGYPLYLTELGGTMILEQQARRVKALNPQEVIFCIPSADIARYNVDFIVRQIEPKAVCVRIPGETRGAVCSALLAGEYLNNDEEVFILAIDDFIDEPFERVVSYFREKECGAGVVAFKSIHPRYSFARVDGNGFVAETAEKQPISGDALASAYYFALGKEFVEAAENVIRKDRRINGKFYLSQTINEMILKQRRVGLFSIKNESYHPLKNEMQLARYVAEYQSLKESK